jgi:hypothetical protein
MASAIAIGLSAAFVPSNKARRSLDEQIPQLLSQ